MTELSHKDRQHWLNNRTYSTTKLTGDYNG